MAKATVAAWPKNAHGPGGPLPVDENRREGSADRERNVSGRLPIVEVAAIHVSTPRAPAGAVLGREIAAGTPTAPRPFALVVRFGVAKETPSPDFGHLSVTLAISAAAGAPDLSVFRPAGVAKEPLTWPKVEVLRLATPGAFQHLLGRERACRVMAQAQRRPQLLERGPLHRRIELATR